VWDDQDLWTSRYDFLHARKVMQQEREEYGPVHVQRHAADAMALLKRTATEIDTRLSV
jgi:hypothetical protein